MDRSAFLFAFCTVATVLLSSCEAQQCPGGPHDVVTPCGNCEKTCEYPTPRFCPTICNINSCACEDGYYRRKDGQCVTFDECYPKPNKTDGYQYPPPKPKVCTGGPHDLVSSCVSTCPATCENPEPRNCSPRCKEFAYCECEKGYYRRKDGKCVTYDECKPKTPEYLPPKVCTGGSHDVVKPCGGCPKTCDNPNRKFCPLICIPNTCECEDGYYRRQDGKCVTIDECPKKPITTTKGYDYHPPTPKPCTGGPHDLFSSCVSSCPATCEHPEPRVCSPRCKEFANCECEKGFYRRKDGRCVTYAECPKKPDIGYLPVKNGGLDFPIYYEE